MATFIGEKIWIQADRTAQNLGSSETLVLAAFCVLIAKLLLSN